MINIINQEVSCSCGQSKFIIHGELLTRFICHCQICQKIYKDNSADILVFSKNSVTLMNDTTIQYF